MLPPSVDVFRDDAAAAKSLRSCPTLCDPIDGSPPPMGFSRQEYWSGVPLPSPRYAYNTMLMAESEEKLKSFLMKVK